MLFISNFSFPFLLFFKYISMDLIKYPETRYPHGCRVTEKESCLIRAKQRRTDHIYFENFKYYSNLRIPYAFPPLPIGPSYTSSTARNNS